MNKLNALSFTHKPVYYLRRPLRFLHETAINLRNAAQRIARGYSKSDVFDVDYYIINLLPQMLRELAEMEIAGYPGVEPFETPEKWHDWLLRIASQFEQLQEDPTNEYSEEYFKSMHRIENNGVIHYEDENPELRKKWFAREIELRQQHHQLLKDTFADFAENFDRLWA